MHVSMWSKKSHGLCTCWRLEVWNLRPERQKGGRKGTVVTWWFGVQEPSVMVWWMGVSEISESMHGPALLFTSACNTQTARSTNQSKGNLFETCIILRGHRSCRVMPGPGLMWLYSGAWVLRTSCAPISTSVGWLGWGSGIAICKHSRAKKWDFHGLFLFRWSRVLDNSNLLFVTVLGS